MILFETKTFKLVENVEKKTLTIYTRQEDKFGNTYFIEYTSHAHYTDMYLILKELYAKLMDKVPTP